MRFGRLVAFGYDTKAYKWFCMCDCGKTVAVRGTSLNRGMTRSCGCLRVDTVKMNNSTHEKNHPQEYAMWCSIIKRTTNIKSSSYSNYGAKGIGVSAEWRVFEQFIEDMGPMPEGMNICHRLDKNLGYSGENCKWSSRAEINRNRAHCVFVNYLGETILLSEASRRSGLSRKTIRDRMKRNWDEARIFEPVEEKNSFARKSRF